VTGTPGVGKSQLSRLLAKRIGAVHIDVGRLALRRKLILGNDIDRGSKIADLHRISNWIRKCVHEAESDLLVEGHYASAVVPKRFVKLVIVLRSDPDELMKRLRKRRLPRRKVYENVAAEILDVCLVDAMATFGRNKVCEVDTTGRTPRSILTEALGLLERRIEPRLGKTDWLGKMAKRRHLDTFMNV
jgi:adenylate kinase